MKYDSIKHLNCGDFRRLTGVKRATFDLMVKILKAAEERRRRGGGGEPA
jgi:hypothetical protein